MDTPSPSATTTSALLRASGREDLTTAAVMAQALVAMELLKAECERLREENRTSALAHANLLTLLASIDDMTEELSDETAALVARYRKRWVEGA